MLILSIYLLTAYISSSQAKQISIKQLYILHILLQIFSTLGGAFSVFQSIIDMLFKF